MLEQKVRQDIARRHRVLCKIKKHPRLEILRTDRTRIHLSEEIAHVLADIVFPGDVPSAKAFFERDAVASDLLPKGVQAATARPPGSRT